jgi:hypothetical protein
MVAFRCYDPSANGSGGVHAWYGQLSPEFRAEIDSTLELLSLEKSLEGLPEVKSLRGACEGLTEIKIDFTLEDAQIHLRILGFDGPDKDEFTLLTGFQKEKNNAIYGVECAKAHERKDGVIRDGRRAPPCGFP